MTKCDLDTTDNVWVEGGICLLDTITEAQVIGVLQVDEKARDDLKRVTSDARLRELAETIPRLPETSEDQKLEKTINNHANSIPFYSVFRGQPPFAQ